MLHLLVVTSFANVLKHSTFQYLPEGVWLVGVLRVTESKMIKVDQLRPEQYSFLKTETTFI